MSSRFIEHFGNGPGSRITLDTAGNDLGVERRRIYDIINVLESLGCVRREAKNRYVWMTIVDLDKKLAALKASAKATLVAVEETSASTFTPGRHSASVPTAPSSSTSAPALPRALNRLDANTIGGAASKRPLTGNRKEKSLGLLCQRFIQLFLIAGPNVVGLDEAATELSDGSPPPPASPHAPVKDGALAKYLKTKVRRLYDIANVLTSLHLIEKVSSRTRKPCFRWKGVEDNQALDSIRGEPRHPSAFVIPPPSVSQRKKPIDLADPARLLPPAKRHAVVPVAASAPKRRKTISVLPADRRSVGASAPALSPDAIEKHISADYVPVWRQFMSYASTHGHVNPKQAAEAIAKAARLAADTETSSEKENQAEECSPVAAAAATSFSTPVAPAKGAPRRVGKPVHSSIPLMKKSSAGSSGECKGRSDAAAAACGPQTSPTQSSDSKCASPEEIRKYMDQARKAGPQYLKAAEKWLADMRKWQAEWGPGAGRNASDDCQPGESPVTPAAHAPSKMRMDP